MIFPRSMFLAAILAVLLVSTAAAQSVSTAPVYRFYNASVGDYLFTLNVAEGQNAPGYVYEGIGFNVYTDSNGGLRPALYRCRLTSGPHAGKHHVTGSSFCDGHAYEGVYGYMHQSSSGQRLWAACREAGGRLAFFNLVSMNYAEVASVAECGVSEIGRVPG